MDQNNPSILGFAQFSVVQAPQLAPPKTAKNKNFEKLRWQYLRNRAELEAEICANRFSVEN